MKTKLALLAFCSFGAFLQIAACSSDDKTVNGGDDSGTSDNDGSSSTNDSGSNNTNGDSSTPKDGSSSNSDAASDAKGASGCADYCTCMANTCASKTFTGGCLTACNAATTWDLGCRTTHCGYAAAATSSGDKTAHCGHANGESICN